MKQYIDKSALLAEIERIENELSSEIFTDEFLGKRWFCKHIKSFLDTLELKESDLDEAKIGETQIYIEDDGGEPPYGGKQWLDLGCLEYEIPKGKFKDGDNVEVIIRKIRKGE